MKNHVGLLLGAALAFCAGPAPAQAPTSIEVIHNSGHSAWIGSLAVAPNGKWLASASRDGAIKLWDVASGRLLRTLTGHTSNVMAAAITPDGRLVVSVSEDRTMKVWEAETGKPLRTITGLSDQNEFPQKSLALTSDGRAAYVNGSNAIRRVDLASGTVQRKFGKQGTFAFWQVVALSPDNRLIAAAHSGAVNAPQKYSAIGSQVKLLDAATGKLVRVLGTYDKEKSVTQVAFSPDGRLVAAAGNAGIARVWEVASGRLLYTLAHADTEKKSGYFNQLAFSPDSRLIATVGGEDGIKLWDAASGRLLRQVNDERHKWSAAIAFFPDGKTIVTSANTTIAVTDAASGRALPLSFGSSNLGYVSVAPIDAGRWVAIGSPGLSVWDMTSGQLVQTYDPKPGNAFGPTYFWGRNAAGHVLVATRAGNFVIKIWDATAGSLVRSIEWTPVPAKDKPCPTCSKYFVGRIAISPDAHWVAATLWGNESPIIKIWDVTSGRLVREVATGAPLRESPDRAPINAANFFAFSIDSRLLIGVVFDRNFKEWVKTWDVGSGRQVGSFRFPEHKDIRPSSSTFGLSPDGRALAYEYTMVNPSTLDARWRNIVATVGFDNGHSFHPFIDNPSPSTIFVIRYSPDGGLILAGYFGASDVNVFDAASGRLLHRLEGNPGSAVSIAFSPDGRRFVIGNGNGTASIWDMQSFARLATTLHVGTEWVTITPEGFFAASAHGAELLHVVRGFETIGIDQVYQSLYRPDLVREKLAGDPRGLVREAASRLDLAKVLATGNAPAVRMVSPADGAAVNAAQVTAEAEISNRDGGVGRVEWRVNGVTVGVDTPAPPQAGQPLRLTRVLNLGDGDNAIEVVAYNARNLIASVPARVSVNRPVAGATAPVRMVVLAVGLNDYADVKFKLNYAVQDAKTLADALKLAGKGLYADVDVTLLQDADATRDKLDAIFAKLAQTVKPTDVFVFYVAGHGKTVDGRYYFVPQDFHFDGDRSNVEAIDKAVLAQGVGQARWQTWFARIPARKSVLLFDTCEAGTLATDKATQALERGAANDRLSRATGRTILTASAGDKEALEGFHDHGLFTYSVLEALEKADSNGDGKIDVAELAAYVHAHVMALSEKVFHERQVPQVHILSNYDFVKPTRVLPAAESEIVIPDKPTHELSEQAELRVLPEPGSQQVRNLAAKTPLTLVQSEGGWALVATHGQPIGYVAARELAPIQ